MRKGLGFKGLGLRVPVAWCGAAGMEGCRVSGPTHCIGPTICMPCCMPFMACMACVASSR